MTNKKLFEKLVSLIAALGYTGQIEIIKDGDYKIQRTHEKWGKQIIGFSHPELKECLKTNIEHFEKDVDFLKSIGLI